MNILQNNKIIEVIYETANKNNIIAYLIGGFIRDQYLNLSSKDIDVVVEGNGIALAEELSKIWESPLNIFKTFGTAMLQHEGIQIEIVSSRKESYSTDSRKPTVIKGTINDDQKRRDFTINTLAVSLQKKSLGKLLDPFNGTEDLKNKIIRTPLNPDITFSDDPLRMLRAIRFACQLDFSIEPKTFDAIANNKERILIVSKERIIEELNKIMACEKPSKGFILLDNCGLLEIIFPELTDLKKTETINNIGHKNIFLHSLKVLDNVSSKSNDLWLRWSALLHDIGKPQTKKFDIERGWTFYTHNFVGAKMIKGIFRKLKLPLNEKMQFVQKMVSLHMRPISLVQEKVTDSAIRRLLYEAGNDIDALMTLCEADITSKNPKKVERFLNNFEHVRNRLKEVEERDSIVNFQPPINGKEIMDIFGLEPSQLIGTLKKSIKDAILDGIIQNNKKAAYNFLIKEGEKYGVKPIQ